MGCLDYWTMPFSSLNFYNPFYVRLRQDMHHFTMPVAASLQVRAIPKIGLMFASVSLASIQPGRIQAWYFAIAVLLYIVVSSWRNYRKIWVSMSSDGLHGKNLFFRPFVVSWTSKVTLSTIAAAFQGKPAGITLLEMDADGIPKYSTIFLPRAITTTPEFKAALAKYAPKDHPLLMLVNAT